MHCIFFGCQLLLHTFPIVFQAVKFVLRGVLLQVKRGNNTSVLIKNFLLLQFDFGVAIFVFGIANFFLRFLNGGIVSSPNPLSVLIHTDVAIHQRILKLGLRLRKCQFLFCDGIFKFLILILPFEFVCDIVRLIHFIFRQHFKLIEIILEQNTTFVSNLVQLGRHLVVVVFVEHCLPQLFIKIVGGRQRRFKFLVDFVNTVGNVIQNTKEHFVKLLNGFIFINFRLKRIKLIFKLIFCFVK